MHKNNNLKFRIQEVRKDKKKTYLSIYGATKNGLIKALYMLLIYIKIEIIVVSMIPPLTRVIIMRDKERCQLFCRTLL